MIQLQRKVLRLTKKGPKNKLKNNNKKKKLVQKNRKNLLEMVEKQNVYLLKNIQFL
jgi:hypothetical protein